jgi:hypothetical protein
MRELAPGKGLGFATRCHYSIQNPPRVVQAAGADTANFVSGKLTAKSGLTMRALRNVRIAWAWKQGHLPGGVLDPFDLVVAVCLPEQCGPPRAP